MNRVFRVLIALAVAGLAGCVGYGYPGSGAYPSGNTGYPQPGQGYPGNGTDPGYGQTLRCESIDNRQRRCNVRVNRDVQVIRQLSRTRCVQGQNWGWDRGGVWVRSGCRADFRVR